eukprot:TRINITY_DN2075_c0_g1_i1.p1 TRINITY_DN2075_c0_g1~~TRINITY_DN2075_c0_g1_i1.p1  ORF type:complete len:471 (+),score=102.42 TRINITY_DN2075_c0_g1_i1:70-1482(+)
MTNAFSKVALATVALTSVSAEIWAAGRCDQYANNDACVASSHCAWCLVEASAVGACFDARSLPEDASCHSKQDAQCSHRHRDADSCGADASCAWCDRIDWPGLPSSCLEKVDHAKQCAGRVWEADTERSAEMNDWESSDIELEELSDAFEADQLADKGNSTDKGKGKGKAEGKGNAKDKGKGQGKGQGKEKGKGKGKEKGKGKGKDQGTGKEKAEEKGKGKGKGEIQTEDSGEPEFENTKERNIDSHHSFHAELKYEVKGMGKGNTFGQGRHHHYGKIIGKGGNEYYAHEEHAEANAGHRSSKGEGKHGHRAKGEDRDDRESQDDYDYEDHYIGNDAVEVYVGTVDVKGKGNGMFEVDGVEERKTTGALVHFGKGKSKGAREDEGQGKGTMQQDEDIKDEENSEHNAAKAQGHHKGKGMEGDEGKGSKGKGKGKIKGKGKGNDGFDGIYEQSDADESGRKGEPFHTLLLV